MCEPKKQLHDLKYYDKMALRLIQQWNYGCRDKVKISDELLGTIVRYMAKADMNYNKEKGLSSYKWRRQAGIYAIRAWIKRKNKFLNFSEMKNIYEYDIEDKSLAVYDTDKNVLNFLINNADLSKEQLLYINMYLNGKTVKIISLETGVGIDNIYYHMRNAIKKMKLILRGSKNEVN